MSGVCSCATSDTCGGSAPICDSTSHDCRSCAADAECDSGACDLAGGGCIDPGEIRYASATGAATGDCTSDAPCSLAHAAGSLDKDHDYIVLKPGAYHGALELAKDAVVCGADSTLDLEGDGITISASATLRLLKITSASGVAAGLTCDACSVVLDHVQVTAGPGATGFHGGPSVKLLHSTFDSWSFALSSTAKTDLSALIDSSSFTAGALVINGAGDARIANSVFADLGTGNLVQVARTDGKDLTARFVNNTFANASISCDGDTTDDDAVSFDSNIFFNTTLAKTADTCTYDYNLGSPAISAGKHDITGDPKFVDAAAHNFKLAAGSPAINATTHNAATNLDHDGISRPQGPAYDIGAYEAKP